MLDLANTCRPSNTVFLLKYWQWNHAVISKGFFQYLPHLSVGSLISASIFYSVPMMAATEKENVQGRVSRNKECSHHCGMCLLWVADWNRCVRRSLREHQHFRLTCGDSLKLSYSCYSQRAAHKSLACSFLHNVTVLRCWQVAMTR